MRGYAIAPFAERKGREQAKPKEPTTKRGMHGEGPGDRSQPSTASLTPSAVERQFEIIGEATRRLANDDISIAEQITGYKTIIGFRNRIIHEYDNIANRTVWEIIQPNLPTLLNEVTTILG